MATLTDQKPRWQDYHEITDPEAVEDHVAMIRQVQQAKRVSIPVFGDRPSFTIHYSEHTSLSLADVGEATYYLHTTFTHPEHRGNGGWRAAMDQLYATANWFSWLLVTHAENPWLGDRLQRDGWQPVTSTEEWDWVREGAHSPLLVKVPVR